MATVKQVPEPAVQPGNGKPSDLASALASCVRAQESAMAEAHLAGASG
jgi:hypothetical protein